MKVIAAKKHFWEWFRLNSQAILLMRKGSEEEFKFWQNECQLHIELFCSPGLGLRLIWLPDEKNAVAVITTFGKEKYFDMAEAFVQDAPFIKEWTFLALFPPAEADYNIAKQHNLPGFDPFGLQFSPFDIIEQTGKCILTIYVETRLMVTQKHKAAVFDVVHNVLGERLTTLYIKKVVLCAYQDAPPERQNAMLLITELPNWFTDLSNVYVDKDGQIDP